MKTSSWDPVAGGQHLTDIEQAFPSVGDAGPTTSQVWIPCTQDSARNTAFSALFLAEALLYAAGIKPVPSSSSFPPALITAFSPLNAALPLAPQGTPVTLGDGLDFLTSQDLRFGSDPNARTLRQRIAMYVLASNRAVRQLVRSSSPFDGAPLLTDDNSLPPTGLPMAPPVNILGLAPAIIVLIGVLGVAAIAGASWTVTEAVKPITAMHVQEASIAAQLAFDTQIALAQIKSGQPVTVSRIAETYSKHEKTESLLPWALGGVVGAGITAAIAKHFFFNQKEKRA